jgi:hypothetical protein
MTGSTSVRLTIPIVALLAMTACDALNPTKPDPVTPVIKTYASTWISASWSGGRTGSPLDSRAVSSTHGGMCPASSLLLENHSTRFQYLFSWSNQVLVFYNNCTAAASLLVCATSGTGGNGSEFPVCDQDPRTTPLSRMAIIDMGPADNTIRSATWRQTGPNLDINIFYCAPGDPFALGVSGSKPTDCLQ